MTARRCGAAAVVAAAAVMLCGGAPAAQQTARPVAAKDTVECSLQQVATNSATRIKQFDQTFVDYIGGGVIVTCPARHYVLTSDSAEEHEAAERWYFFGHVHYNEPRLDLHSDVLHYFQVGDSIQAIGNVHAVQPTGTSLDGPAVSYYPESPGRRPKAQVLATDRPTMRIAQKDSLGRPDSTITVSALTLFMDGDSLLYASKQVVINRASVTAHSDSAFLDLNAEVTHLIGRPVINGVQGRKFELKGTLIDAYSPHRKLERILARGKASAVSLELSLLADTIDIRIHNDSVSRVIARLNATATDKDMQLVADTIDMRISNNLLGRAIAWNRTKEAQAISPSQTITADSINIVMPDQKLRSITAVRHAVATRLPDTAKMRVVEPDEMWGDTVIAYFDSLPSRDTTKSASVREIVAIADTRLATKTDSLRAKALYHLQGRDTVSRLPVISYIQAKHEIAIDFTREQPSVVTVSGGVEGFYTSPLDSTKAKPADSTAKKPPTKKPPPTPRPL